jgi:hypothetical protein
VHTSVATLQQSFNNDEFQKAADIDASMQKLNLYELEINAIADAIRRLRAQGKQYSAVPKGANNELASFLGSGWKLTHLTSVFSLWASVTSPHGFCRC